MAAGEPKATLYDFAYIDRERAKSLTAQLFSGLNTSVQKNNTITESSTTEGGINVGVTGKHSYTSLSSIGDSKIYDPHDLSHMDLVNGLREEGYLKENPSTCHVGDIILVAGQLSIVNFDAIKPVLNLLTDTKKKKNTLKDGILQKIPQAEASKFADTLDFAMHIVPMTIQVYFKTNNQTIWGMIDGANSREPIGNVALKYGPAFPGIWYMLAIVDVVGDSMPDISSIPESMRGLIGIIDTLRPLFGRPTELMGVTPLLLFRELSQ